MIRRILWGAQLSAPVRHGGRHSVVVHPGIAGSLLHRTLTTEVPPYEVVTMPALSPTMEAGTIVEWTVAPGGEVAAGSLLCEVETDKATVGFEFQDDAIIAKYLVEAGTEVAVGTPVAITVDDDDAFAAFKTADSAGQISIDNTAATPIDSIITPPPEPSLADSQMANAAPPPAPVATSSLPPATPPASRLEASHMGGGRVFASPFARKLAREQDLDIRWDRRIV